MSKRVFEEKKKCSGCGKCVAVCPVSAITMVEDESTYLFPTINEDICIHCNRCVKECPFNGEHVFTIPVDTYMAARKDKKCLMMSASGGAFASIAEHILRNGGYVCGSIYDSKTESAKHIVTNDPKKVRRMYGSKYVQSSCEDTYRKVEELVREGNNVLFSGTPCQVAAVKSYVGCSEKLTTVEIICHGVSSGEMLKSYLEIISDKIAKKRRGWSYNLRLNLSNNTTNICTEKNTIKNVNFRDKTQGWSYNLRLNLSNGSSIKVPHRLSSYMTYYLSGETYRNSCYHCPYAKPERGADITIGDFWGVAREYPVLAKQFDIDKGVSCVMVNTEKGQEIIKQLNGDMRLFQIDYEAVKKGNEPLNKPSSHTEKREEIMAVWNKRHDWLDVDQYWKKNDYRFYYRIWSALPNGVKNNIRLVLRKR